MTVHTDSTDITQATAQPEALVTYQTPGTAFGVIISLKAETSPKGPLEMLRSMPKVVLLRSKARFQTALNF